MAERLISQNQSASGVVLCIRIMGNVTSGHDEEFEDIHLYMYVHSYVCVDRKSTRLNSSHMSESRMPSSA